MRPLRSALKDIRVRAVIVAVVPLVVVSLVLSGWFTRLLISGLEDSIIDRGQIIVRQLAASSEFGVFTANREILQRLADRTVKEEGIDGVTIRTNDDGTVLAQAGAVVTDGEGWKSPPPVRTRTTVDGPFVFNAPVVLQRNEPGDPFLGLFEIAAAAEGRSIGLVTLILSSDALVAGRKRLIAVSLALTLLGLVAASLLAARMARTLTRPVLSLADTVSKIEQGDLTARARIDATGALEVLETGINDMAAAMATARDDLERRIGEATGELQRQKDEAENATRTKSQFLAAASHDLRQPLQALGLAVMSLRLDKESVVHQTSIARIERALANLEGVLEALLDISRLDAGIVTPRVEHFPVERLFDRLREQYEVTAERYGLVLSLHKSAFWLESDAALLERVLANLISNALRYTRKGTVLVGCRWRAAKIRIEVRDTGPGIPGDRREAIFREFVQLNNEVHQGEKGLGLGLAIVQRLCRLLGHEMGLDSTPAKGSVFWVEVPRTERETIPPSGSPPSGAVRSLRNRVIMVIDDDQDVREALVDLFDRHGASALAAADETQARHLINDIAVPPDLILSDYRLGNGIDGVAVIHALRRDYGAEIPAAILTGDVAPAVTQHVRNAGLLMFTKPFSPTQLVEEIAALASAWRAN